MCGILGVLSNPGSSPTVLPRDVARMRDTMESRGPDEEGLIADRHVIFAHRRLSILDPENGSQPWRSSCGRFLLVYNGELYNDLDLRTELEAEGVSFQTACDTETVLEAMASWGLEAIQRFRGMFALALYDFQDHVLTLARDPLGIKPLYYTQVNREFMFASHLPAILAHPQANPAPDMAVVSSYLTTIRTTLGRRTMFDSVNTVLPGEILQCHMEGERTRIHSTMHWHEPQDVDFDRPRDEWVAELRTAVVDSVDRHLRSDVPRCVLLSGGLDSAIIAAACIELGATDALNAWCATDPTDEGQDLEHARLMAAACQADLHEVIVDEEDFHQNWMHLVDLNGLPLSTPNETAILAVARDLQPHARVALSGEGADELFAGYASPLLSGIDGLRTGLDESSWPGDEAARARYRHELNSEYGTVDLADPVVHYLRCNSWIAPGQKANLLTAEAFQAIADDENLAEDLRAQFSMDPGSIDQSERILRVHRRINLTGLLARLDTSTMAAGVEGRTPFADSRLAELALSIPLDQKVRITPAGDGGWSTAGSTIAAQNVATKTLLREAFADVIPGAILNRPKASFPLPFTGWMHRAATEAARSESVHRILRTEVIDAITGDPSTNWQLAWPLLNLALWCRRWWG